MEPYVTREALIAQKAREKGISIQELNAHFHETCKEVLRNHPVGISPAWVVGRAEYLIWEHFFGPEPFPSDLSTLEVVNNQGGSMLYSGVPPPAGNVPLAGLKQLIPAPRTAPTQAGPPRKWGMATILTGAGARGYKSSEVERDFEVKFHYAQDRYPGESREWQHWLACSMVYRMYFKEDGEYPGAEPPRTYTLRSTDLYLPKKSTGRPALIDTGVETSNQGRSSDSLTPTKPRAAVGSRSRGTNHRWIKAGPLDLQSTSWARQSERGRSADRNRPGTDMTLARLNEDRHLGRYHTLEKVMEGKAVKMGERVYFFQTLQRKRDQVRLSHPNCSKDHFHWLADKLTWEAVFVKQPFPGKEPRGAGVHSRGCQNRQTHSSQMPIAPYNGGVNVPRIVAINTSLIPKAVTEETMLGLTNTAMERVEAALKCYINWGERCALVIQNGNAQVLEYLNTESKMIFEVKHCRGDISIVYFKAPIAREDAIVEITRLAITATSRHLRVERLPHQGQPNQAFYGQATETIYFRIHPFALNDRHAAESAYTFLEAWKKQLTRGVIPLETFWAQQTGRQATTSPRKDRHVIVEKVDTDKLTLTDNRPLNRAEDDFAPDLATIFVNGQSFNCLAVTAQNLTSGWSSFGTPSGDTKGCIVIKEFDWQLGFRIKSVGRKMVHHTFNTTALGGKRDLGLSEYIVTKGDEFMEAWIKRALDADDSQVPTIQDHLMEYPDSLKQEIREIVTSWDKNLSNRVITTPTQNVKRLMNDASTGATNLGTQSAAKTASTTTGVPHEGATKEGYTPREASEIVHTPTKGLKKSEKNRISKRETPSQLDRFNKDSKERLAGQRLYVGNIHLDAKETDLLALFADLGALQAEIKGTGSGYKTTFGFVVFDSVSNANRAMETRNGAALFGLGVRIEPSESGGALAGRSLHGRAAVHGKEEDGSVWGTGAVAGAGLKRKMEDMEEGEVAEREEKKVRL